MCNAWNARLHSSNWASICMWIDTSDCFYLMLFCPFLFLLCAISTWDCAFLFSFWPLLTWYPGLIHSRWFVALCKIDICPSSCVKQHVYNNKDSLLRLFPFRVCKCRDDVIGAIRGWCLNRSKNSLLWIILQAWPKKFCLSPPKNKDILGHKVFHTSHSIFYPLITPTRHQG